MTSSPYPQPLQSRVSLPPPRAGLCRRCCRKPASPLLLALAGCRGRQVGAEVRHVPRGVRSRSTRAPRAPPAPGRPSTNNCTNVRPHERRAKPLSESAVHTGAGSAPPPRRDLGVRHSACPPSSCCDATEWKAKLGYAVVISFSAGSVMLLIMFGHLVTHTSHSCGEIFPSAASFTSVSATWNVCGGGRRRRRRQAAASRPKRAHALQRRWAAAAWCAWRQRVRMPGPRCAR